MQLILLINIFRQNTINENIFWTADRVLVISAITISILSLIKCFLNLSIIESRLDHREVLASGKEQNIFNLIFLDEINFEIIKKSLL